MFSTRFLSLASCFSPKTSLQTCSGGVNPLGVFAEGGRFSGITCRSPHLFSCLLVMKPRRRSSGAAGGGRTPSKSPSKGGVRHKENIFDKTLSKPFEVYWTKEKVQNGLKRGTLAQGILTISYSNYAVAFVSNPGGGPDFLIDGMLARNRALHDDVVVVEILEEVDRAISSTAAATSADQPSPDQPSVSGTPQSPAHSSCDPSLTTTVSCEHQSLSTSASCVPSSGDQTFVTPSSGDPSFSTASAAVPPSCSELSDQISSLYVSDNAHGDSSHGADVGGSPPSRETLIDRLYSKSGRELSEEQNPALKEKQRKAQVVYIVEKVHTRACIGTIKAFDKSKQLALLSPRDTRVPRVLLPLSQLPADMPGNFRKYECTNFVCRLKDWQLNSVFPSGYMMRSLGEAGVVEGETEALLIDNDIDYEEFSDEVNACLPKDEPWTIPKEEIEKRRDFRKECVVTVDPETARDLDDALHIKKLSGDTYEVGVHIADVSYFVKPNTALDEVASRRATSTYLVHKVIPMLPRLLCENLCSLNPNEDKLSFSVVWQLTSKGEFISQWMGRSIIRSCCKLSYGNAQDMIDGVWKPETLPPISGGFPIPQVVDSVVSLNNLAKALKTLRLSKGTLRLDQPKPHYILDDSTGMPIGCEVYPIRASNRMIEEFMLLANMSVARCISEAFPDGAMLRRHPPPRQMAVDELVVKCASLGLALDASSAASIQQSLDQCKGRNGQPTLTEVEKLAFVLMCVKVMELAVYFSAGANSKVTPHHYALNVPLYTHFTSPIRRYADVIVHRQLAHALGEGPAFTGSFDEVDEQAVQCNKKKKAAKNVGDLSIDMFFSIMLKETGPQTFRGVVVTVHSKYFEVLVMKYGLVRTVFCNQLKLKSFELVSGDGGESELKLVWDDASPEDGKTYTEQTIKVFSEVDITLSALPKDIFKNKAVIAPQQKS